MPRRSILILLGLALTGILYLLLRPREEPVDFSSQVKPIINERCIACHGGVKKNGGFSLLFEEEALAPTESGHPAIIPGDPDGSELIKRLTHEDPELRMPYQQPPLPEEEIELLRDWIEQEAEWGVHWAYRPVREPEMPAPVARGSWGSAVEQAGEPIDQYVRRKLAAQGLTPAPEEEPMRLLRRVSFDIIGLPPSDSLARAFMEGQTTYQEAVDHLLADPAYGEKWAVWWLDLARYADTKGYERDPSRTMWPYRDWVIRAFNTDLPFDEFTIHQLAGDLLADPTRDQLTATAFHRNTMNNDEGGTQDEEFRVAALIDRVNTTYEVWQSTTMACVQCHSHPYDPIKHEEFYQSAAFFNNTRDEDTHDEEPRLRFYEDLQQRQVETVVEWVRQTEGEQAARARKDFLTFYEPKYPAHDATEHRHASLVDTKWLGIRCGGSVVFKDVETRGSDQMLLLYRAGLEGTRMTIRRDGPEGERLASFLLEPGNGVRQIPFKPVEGPVDLYWEAYHPEFGPDRNTSFITWMAFVPRLKGQDRPGYREAKRSWDELLAFQGTRLPILIENPPYMARETHVFERGNWLLPGEPVEPETPDQLGSWDEAWPDNRLGFAYWLTDPENPLTARTLVNRVWDQLFGRGLVNTLEDMGSQSEPPTHPELLDYLAWQAMHTHDWSVKGLIREIVTSATYRQASAISETAYRQDPGNAYYARGPRFRLSAEQVRDQALAVSGLLSRKMYGPPVMPPQPEGVWQTVYNGESWVESEGEDKYRRGLYTFVKRTSPYPSFIAFDAGSREVCLSKRQVTNTPLQALVTLNDPVYLEAARNLARKAWTHHSQQPGAAIEAAYDNLMLGPMSAQRAATMQELFERARATFSEDPEALQAFFPGAKPGLAALAVVTNAMLNLDAFLTKS